MEKSLWLDFPATISDIAEKNESFDTCKIWILYTGESRNKTTMTKESVEEAIPSLYNVPIVCNYSIDDDTIGGHDVAIVENDDGMRLVNLTDAVGVIPYGAECKWEVNENDGREYLTAEGLLWKRAAAYQKIKKDGVESQSMEINVKAGKKDGDLYRIDAFTFTALCLLGEGIEPCFENASLTFSMKQCKETCEKMFAELAQTYNTTSAASAVDDIENSGKGGEEKMQEEEKKVFEETENVQNKNSAEENVNAEAENGQVKFDDQTGETGGDAGTEGGEGSGSGSGSDAGEGSGSGSDAGEGSGSGSDAGNTQGSGDANTDDADSDITVIANGSGRKYSLSVNQIRTDIEAILRECVEMDEEFGCKRRKYWMHDFDLEKMELYVEDTKDYRLYALPFAIDGDKVSVDFACAKRVKVVYETIDESENAEEVTFSVSEAYSEVLSELKNLREFKLSKDNEARKDAESEVFSRFADLESNEEFRKLQENCGDLSIDQIEEKCFAIRGRSMVMKFSAEENAPVRTPVEKMSNANVDLSNEPYGGLFVEFANK